MPHIFRCDIFPIQEKSHEDEKWSEKSEPVIRRKGKWSTHRRLSIESDETNAFTRDSHRRIRLHRSGCGIIDEKEGSEEHESTEWDDRPLPEFFSENPWIEYTTDKSDKRKYIESMLQLCRKSEVDRCHTPSEVYDEKKEECENDTDDAYRLIAWFLCEFRENIYHIEKWLGKILWFLDGGEREIRTPGILRYAPFPRVCTRPLCDLSRIEKNVSKREEKARKINLAES